MNEPELRALVREVIARRASVGPSTPGIVDRDPKQLIREHASHAMFLVPSGSDGDGPCLIEPAVMCNHCGYCRSYGH